MNGFTPTAIAATVEASAAGAIAGPPAAFFHRPPGVTPHDRVCRGSARRVTATARHVARITDDQVPGAAVPAPRRRVGLFGVIS